MFRPVEEEFGPSPLKQIKEEGLKRGNSQFLAVTNNSVRLKPSNLEGQVWFGQSQLQEASATMGRWEKRSLHLLSIRRHFNKC